MPRRVLLITPVFYGIEQKIRVALEESGYQVVWIENKTLPLDYHGTASKFKILRKFYFLLFSPAKRYLKEQLKNISDPHFDILFSINAHAICPYLFKYLKKQNPHLYSILYLWDSFSKFSWKRELRYFNRVLTFYPADSLRYNLEYKPNFYLAQDDQLSDCDKIDLFFVGKFSRNRLLLLDKIVDLLKSKGIKYFIKLLPAYKICCHNQFVYRILKTLPFNSEWVLKYLLNYEAVEGLLDRDFLIHDAIGPVDLQHKLLFRRALGDAGGGLLQEAHLTRGAGSAVLHGDAALPAATAEIRWHRGVDRMLGVPAQGHHDHPGHHGRAVGAAQPAAAW